MKIMDNSLLGRSIPHYCLLTLFVVLRDTTPCCVKSGDGVHKSQSLERVSTVE